MLRGVVSSKTLHSTLLLQVHNKLLPLVLSTWPGFKGLVLCSKGLALLAQKVHVGKSRFVLCKRDIVALPSQHSDR